MLQNRCSKYHAFHIIQETMLNGCRGSYGGIRANRIGCCHNVIIGNLVIMQTNRLERQKFCSSGWNQQWKSFVLTKPLKSELPFLLWQHFTSSSHVFKCWILFYSFYRNSKIRFRSRGYALCKFFKQKKQNLLIINFRGNVPWVPPWKCICKIVQCMSDYFQKLRV